MKKIFLKNLEKEKTIELVKNNKKLMNELYEDYCELQTEMQSEDAKNIMGEDWYEYVECRNNYNSFYLKLKNWEKFYENLNPDYLSINARKIYDKLENKIKKLNKIEYAEDGYFEFEDKIENDCRNLLQDVENYLHCYEELPNNDEIIIYYIDNSMLFDDDYYILIDDDGNNDGIIRLDVAYTKNFN